MWYIQSMFVIVTESKLRTKLLLGVLQYMFSMLGRKYSCLLRKSTIKNSEMGLFQGRASILMVKVIIKDAESN